MTQIVVDAVGCVFNVMKWLNDHVKSHPLVGSRALEYHQLVYPVFVDNYVNTPIKEHFTDTELVESILNSRLVGPMEIVDGAIVTMDKLRKLGHNITIVMPHSKLGFLLEARRMLENMPHDVVYYINNSVKYPARMIEPASYVIDDSKNECDQLVEKGVQSPLLLDMPWNKGTTRATRISSWQQALKIITGGSK